MLGDFWQALVRCDRLLPRGQAEPPLGPLTPLLPPPPTLQEKLGPMQPTEEAIPLMAYLNRHRRGVFWTLRDDMGGVMGDH